MNKLRIFKIPKVVLLHSTPIGLAEVATRCCYDSFDRSDNEVINQEDFFSNPQISDDLRDCIASPLVGKISKVFFHKSVLEHINFSFLIKGISRSVLQELARHRIASYSVRSTRYTLSDIAKAVYALNVCGASLAESTRVKVFCDMFEDTTTLLDNTDLKTVYYNLSNNIGLIFDTALHPSTISFLDGYGTVTVEGTARILLQELLYQPNSRNAGDSIKHLGVTENTSVDLVMTINLRSLENFLKLRDSNSAWFPMQVLAKEIKYIIPDEYLEYIKVSNEKKT